MQTETATTQIGTVVRMVLSKRTAALAICCQVHICSKMTIGDRKLDEFVLAYSSVPPQNITMSSYLASDVPLIFGTVIHAPAVRLAIYTPDWELTVPGSG